MADILFGEYPKKILRMTMVLVRKRLGASIEIVDQDMDICQNEAIKAIDTVLVAASNQIIAPWQQKMSKEFGRLALWILYKDTAYKDMFIWMLHQILKHADKLLPVVEKMVKQPDEWTPNVWWKARQTSEKMRQENKIPKNWKSLEESVFNYKVD
jgi:hypothetical protein